MNKRIKFKTVHDARTKEASKQLKRPLVCTTVYVDMVTGHQRCVHKQSRKDDLYMGIAQAVSHGGTCPRAQVGAVVVKDDRVVGLGYNGAPRGEEHCGCILERRRGRDHCIKAVHAEVNAVLNGYGDMRGGTLYCTHEPCYDCLRLLLNAGIKRLVFNGGSYQDDKRQKALLLRFETTAYHKALQRPGEYKRPVMKLMGHSISGYQAHNL